MHNSALIRTKETYFDKISTKAENTQSTSVRVINKFEEFCKTKHNISFDELRQEDIIDLLQAWINFRYREGIMPSTIKLQFTHLNQFLYYMGIKLFPQDIKNDLTFPKKTTEEPVPLELQDITQLFKYCKGKKQALYLALLSSGMRTGELVQIRKRDLDFTKKRVMVKIPARYTKTKAARTTFLSKEAAVMISPKLREIGDDDLVWGTNDNPHYAGIAQSKAFNKFCRLAGLSEKYESNGRMKITLHAFRAYFFTKAVRVHDENYAHKMTGHDGYLMQYDRLSVDEKLEMYLKLEPELLVYDTSKKDAKIADLEMANNQLSEQAQDIQDLKLKQKQYEKMLLELSSPEMKKWLVKNASDNRDR